MDNIQTKFRNEAIAKFLGWFREDGQSESWFFIPDDGAGKYVAYSEYKDRYRGLPFSHDFGSLLQVIERIQKTMIHSNQNSGRMKRGEFMIDEFRLTLTSLYIKLFEWTKTGWRMTNQSSQNKDLSILYILNENAESYHEILFLGLSDLAISVLKLEKPEVEKIN